MTFQEVQFNGRCLAQPLTGVQRYVVELSRKLENELFTIKPAQEWAQGLRGHSWEQIYLPRLCDRRLLWSPGNTGPLVCANQLVTIHDASTLDHPEWFERKFAVLYGWLLPKLARRVRAIITVSAFSKERLISRLRVPESKIHVVPNGLSEDFQLEQESDLDAQIREPLLSLRRFPRTAKESRMPARSMGSRSIEGLETCDRWRARRDFRECVA